MIATSFFADTKLAAIGLLGMHLVVRHGKETLRARIVETEAYLGYDDPASHGYRGPTPRTQVMFGPPGTLYVYRSYGVHWCANVVTMPEGTPGAVLIRAAEVVDGLSIISTLRNPPTGLREPLSGPGNLCKGLGITLSDNGTHLVHEESRIRLAEGEGAPRHIVESTRIGISKAAERPYRYFLADSPAVSGTKKGFPLGEPRMCSMHDA